MTTFFWGVFYGTAEEAAEKVAHEAKSVPQRLKRLRKNDDCHVLKEGPGLKPHGFAGFFAGLKPCAPTVKTKRDFFRSLLKPHYKAKLLRHG